MEGWLDREQKPVFSLFPAEFCIILLVISRLVLKVERVAF